MRNIEEMRALFREACNLIHVVINVTSSTAKILNKALNFSLINRITAGYKLRRRRVFTSNETISPPFRRC
ncbi:hypothetical protein PUN28_005707 [Cardiocondyla obscurior]|uniref:Uncharacterized protein n=1 Tax=Cardiocondyla obscurior TaxID=286306 RepID=A0AAW2G814_9HYME